MSAHRFPSVKPDNVERSFKNLLVPDTASDSHEGTPIEAAVKYTPTLKQGLSGSQTKKDTPSSASNGKDDDSGGTAADAGEGLKVFKVE